MLWEPPVVLVPLQPPEAVQLVAFVLLQVNVAALPDTTVAGAAANVTVGAGVGAGAGGGVGEGVEPETGVGLPSCSQI